jgi:uncharacterized protein YdaU (DUF1376 family)
MAKDPAFLFYFRDFLVGTEFMSPEEVGHYIRILCHMADKGRLTLKHMQSICKAYGPAHELHNHFKTDENELFYNERLESELEKRRNYTQSRRENASHAHKAYAQHMGNANANGNTNTTIPNTDPIFKGNHKFIPPSLDDVRSYIQEKGSSVSPDAFHAYYESNGWVQGKNKPIKNWKACLKTWEIRNQDNPKGRQMNDLN